MAVPIPAAEVDKLTCLRNRRTDSLSAMSDIDATDVLYLSTLESSSMDDELGLDLPLASDANGAMPDLDLVLRFFSTDKPKSFFGPYKYQVLARIAGTGLAPCEIHRPQPFVRELVMQHKAFFGRVLDAGCGIGDNALYIAKSCPNVSVTAVDVVQRCLDFGAAKARVRGMLDRVVFVAADMTEYDSLPEEHRSDPYDVVLDSSMFHTFSDSERQRYMSVLQQLVRLGGVVFINAVSEQETRPGALRRVTMSDVRAVFSEANGWAMEGVQESCVELHPSFWDGRGRSRLYTIRRM